MTWLQQLAFALLGGGSLGGAVGWCLWWMRGKTIDRLMVEVADWKNKAQGSYLQLEAGERRHKDERNRLEGVAARMRAEIDGLEFDLAACAVQLPGSVRERFNKLYALGVPSPGSDKALP